MELLYVCVLLAYATMAGTIDNRLLRTTYRALLKQAKRVDTILALNEPLSLNNLTRVYGRGSYVEQSQPTAAQHLQSTLFPGVDFADLGFKDRSAFSGNDIMSLVRNEYRRAPAVQGHAMGSDAAMAALRQLSQLRQLNPCNTSTISEHASGAEVTVEVATIYVPAVPLDLAFASQSFAFSYRSEYDCMLDSEMLASHPFA